MIAVNSIHNGFWFLSVQTYPTLYIDSHFMCGWGLMVGMHAYQYKNHGNFVKLIYTWVFIA